MPKISDLPSGIPTTADVLPLVQGGTTKKATFNDVPVSSATQTALNLKADANNPTFTGTVTGVSKTAVGLSNVDNTSDVNKPISTAQQAAINLLNGPRVARLIGNNNTTTPLTKYDLAADIVVLRNSSGSTITSYNASATCDLGLAGSAANGRDQAGAFTANSWVHLYFIWNGTTLATLASTTLPSAFTGATLPSGYTHWCFATTVRWNASSNIPLTYVRGKAAAYDVAVRLVSVGTATVFTTVSLGTVVPPNTLLAKAIFICEGNWGTVGTFGSVNYRVTGSSAVAGYNGPSIIQIVASATHTSTNTQEFPVSSGQQIDYKLAATPVSGGFYFDVIGYSVANGDA